MTRTSEDKEDEGRIKRMRTKRKRTKRRRTKRMRRMKRRTKRRRKTTKRTRTRTTRMRGGIQLHLALSYEVGRERGLLHRVWHNYSDDARLSKGGGVAADFDQQALPHG